MPELKEIFKEDGILSKKELKFLEENFATVAQEIKDQLQDPKQKKIIKKEITKYLNREDVNENSKKFVNKLYKNLCGEGINFATTQKTIKEEKIENNQISKKDSSYKKLLSSNDSSKLQNYLNQDPRKLAEIGSYINSKGTKKEYDFLLNTASKISPKNADNKESWLETIGLIKENFEGINLAEKKELEPKPSKKEEKEIKSDLVEKEDTFSKLGKYFDILGKEFANQNNIISCKGDINFKDPKTGQNLQIEGKNVYIANLVIDEKNNQIIGGQLKIDDDKFWKLKFQDTNIASFNADTTGNLDNLNKFINSIKKVKSIDEFANKYNTEKNDKKETQIANNTEKKEKKFANEKDAKRYEELQKGLSDMYTDISTRINKITEKNFDKEYESIYDNYKLLEILAEGELSENDQKKVIELGKEIKEKNPEIYAKLENETAKKQDKKLAQKLQEKTEKSS